MKLPVPLSPTKVTGFAPVDPTVVVMKTSPATVLEDIRAAMDKSGLRSNLNPSATTILKDNISWHFPFPAANTTP